MLNFKKINIFLLIIIFFFSVINTSYSKKGDNNNPSSQPQVSNMDITKPIGKLSYSTTLQVKSSVGVKVTLTCDDEDGGSGCKVSEVSNIFRNNGNYSLSIEDNAGNKTTKLFEIKNIDDIAPNGEFTFNPSHSEWTHGPISVTLSCDDSDITGFNRYCGNSPLPFQVYSEFNTNGNYNLKIKDVAGNETIKPFTISNIDNTPPKYNLEYLTIANGDTEQTMIITCADEKGGSGCKIEDQNFILIKPLNTIGNINIEDNAGNITTFSYSTAAKASDYNDILLPWTNSSRYLWITCSDNFSGCLTNKVEKIIYENTPSIPLTISDKAGNSVTRNFEILKIDNKKPIISINSLNYNDFWKASETNKLKLEVNDIGGSELEYSKYIWDDPVNCKNSGTSFNNNDTINYTKSGNHIIYICARDYAGNEETLQKEFKIYPGDLSELKTELSVDGSLNKFANNNDFYKYTISLKDKYGNSIYSKKINSIELGGVKIYNDMTSNTGGLATSIFDFNNESDINGNITFKIKSLSPGIFEQKFKFSMYKWLEDYTTNYNNSSLFNFEKLIEKNNEFLKPIIGELSIIEGGDFPEIGLNQKYKIELINIGYLFGYSYGNINISSGTIINKTSGHFWNKFNLINDNFGNDSNNDLLFSGSLDAVDNILSGVQISTNNLIINYNIGNNNVKYYLDNFGINGCSSETLGLKVIGNLQGDGKSEITGQNKNISDLSKFELKSSIRKNAYLLIKNMISGRTINGVKYFEGDIRISGEVDYETLIVKNGNVIIDNDLNTSGKKLGIIVLKDNYSLESDYDNNGNVYVNNNVEKINAIIYSDGVFRSSDLNGNSYPDIFLNKQLELKGSLFSKNTIGGAVSVGGDYLLPGGQFTNDYNLAEIYDLNYIRKVPNSCGSDNNYSFIIKYNPTIQTNPPKGFEK